MTASEIFDGLLDNLKVDNSETIANRRNEIAKTLNREFRGTEGSTQNQMMVGSYGRFTAIRGISDLDMIYILPPSLRGSYQDEDGPGKVLAKVRKGILRRYAASDVSVSQLVVVVQFQDFKFEVQPVFENEDTSFSYPDTHSQSWKVTKPRDEIATIRDHNELTRGNLRNLSKMTRAWKNAHGIQMGGLLIDTLVYNFFQKTTDFNGATTMSYDNMVRNFFQFLSKEEDHEYYVAPGSRQHVRVKKKFQSKAKQAYKLCLEAIDADSQVGANKKWKAIFGRPVPSAKAAEKSRIARSFDNTEQFIEDRYPVDICHSLTIDCRITQNGFRPGLLTKFLEQHFPLMPDKSLDFFIEECSAEKPYVVKWKVLNRGEEARRRNMIRGEILDPNRSEGRNETTRFRGEHYVECYVIKAGVVVARDHIKVPITPY